MKRAAWSIALLLAWCPVPAAADVPAGVAAYKQGNFTGALIEFEDSAKRDDVRALNYLGIMYAEGMGTPRDDAKAAAMFAKAALLGFPEAMANMGRMHAEGRGVPQDNEAAVAAFSAAARSGFQPAISRMVMIYEKGDLGVAPDAAQADAWRARLSAPSVQSVPAAAVAVPAATDTVAATPPAQAAETADTAAPAGTGPARLPPPQAAEAVPPQAAAPVSEAIAPETIAPAVVAPQAAQAPEPQTPSLPASPPPDAVAVPATATIPATATPPPEPIQEQQTQAVDTAPAPAPAFAQNVIQSIVVTLQTGETLIRVRTLTPLEVLPADFVVATPPRIVFDFPHVVTDLGRYNEVGAGDLQSVDVISGDSRTRVVLILRNAMQHDAKMDDGDLLIRLLPIAAPATGSSADNPSQQPGR